MRHMLVPVLSVTVAMMSPTIAVSAADEATTYTFLNPTPREKMRDLSTDRPDTTESPYTVDAGHIQVEIEALSWTRDNVGDETTTTVNANANIKLGLNERCDVQAVIEPFRNVRTSGGGANFNETGLGDLTFRLKYNLWGDNGGESAFAIMPFVTLPTHSDRLDANRDTEGGIILPLAVDLGQGWDMGVMLELDFVRNTNDNGYVAQWLQSITLSHAIVGDLGGFAEVVNITNAQDDVGGQSYFNCGATYGFNADTQFDFGTNIGLTEASDDIRLFIGVSVRR